MDFCIVNSQCAIRTMSNEQGEPLFCAKDVCDALGYKKTINAIAQHVDKEGALKQGTLTNRGIQQMLYVNESGLYSLILGSTHKAVRRHVENENGMKRPTPTASDDCKSI